MKTVKEVGVLSLLRGGDAKRRAANCITGLKLQNRGQDQRRTDYARSRVICPGGVGFDTRAASRGAGWGQM
ncbi:MAG TPA: hypothetical protein VKJ65_09525 [Phycisphaerae bacterium]|nr:hypothetical protein [Phycisphaerae bacterium]